MDNKEMTNPEIPGCPPGEVRGRRRTMRVLAVTGVASNMSEAHRRAYQGASLVTFEGKVTRSDIARAAI